MYPCMCFYTIDPNITIEVTINNIPLIDQPLILQCNAVIVGAITSTVDIIWTSDDTQVRRVNNVTARSSINSTSVYYDSFIIPSFDITDIDSVYHCEVLINSNLPTTASSNVTISIPSGTELLYYYYVYFVIQIECDISLFLR